MTPDERAARIAGHRTAHELDLLHDGPRQYLDPESCATCWFIDALDAETARADAAEADCDLAYGYGKPQRVLTAERERDEARAALDRVRALFAEWGGRETNDDTWHMYEELRVALGGAA